MVGDKGDRRDEASGQTGEFRSNLHRGGSASLDQDHPGRSAWPYVRPKIMGPVGGRVDILRSNHGPLVMEVNSSPGLEGIRATTGKDVASIIIDYLKERHSRPDPHQGGAGLPLPARSCLSVGVAQQQQPQRRNGCASGPPPGGLEARICRWGCCCRATPADCAPATTTSLTLVWRWRFFQVVDDDYR